jgi:6-methylsalicylate decarboxylase
MESAQRIDVHQHLISPSSRELLYSKELTAGGWPVPDWSPEAAIALMGVESITTSILSLSSPGVRLGSDAASRKLAREVNEFGAQLVRDNPDHFGLFASVPLPDIDSSVEEAIYALDTLHADGIVLLSNAEGHYLGDSMFEPLWSELNERSAVVFIHPTEPPFERLKALPSPIVDYPFDTTRTALDMVAHGVMSRYQKMKVILSRAGGFLPYAAYRFSGAAPFIEGSTTEGMMTDMKRFYFDTALSSSPSALPSLLEFADPTHIVFGSDFPFVPKDISKRYDSWLDEYPMSEEQRTAINHGNAEILFPRLAALSDSN